MRYETFLQLAAPAFSLDWDYEPHKIALATTLHEAAGTALEHRVKAGEPQAFVELITLVAQKAEAARKLRRAFALEPEPETRG